jgi:hypothetical protein
MGHAPFMHVIAKGRDEVARRVRVRLRQMRSGATKGLREGCTNRHLTLSQWLPKPATN